MSKGEIKYSKDIRVSNRTLALLYGAKGKKND